LAFGASGAASTPSANFSFGGGAAGEERIDTYTNTHTNTHTLSRAEREAAESMCSLHKTYRCGLTCIQT
jgi:hypothetical protein